MKSILEGTKNIEKKDFDLLDERSLVHQRFEVRNELFKIIIGDHSLEKNIKIERLIETLQ